MKTIVRLFDDVSMARDAVQDLLNAGFEQQHITLMAYDPHGDYGNLMAAPEGAGDVGEEAAAGAGIGALIGGIGGLLLGLGALTITGIGPIVAAGPMAAALLVAGTGATIGGLVGLLMDADIDEEHAQLYAEGVRRGGTLVVMQAEEEEAQRAIQILDRLGPVHLAERSTGWRSRGWSGYKAGDEPYAADDVELEQNFYTFEPVYRRHYERMVDSRGYPYSRYEPAYYYGYDLVARGDYHDREWKEIEPEVRRDWESRDQGTWGELGSAVRYAWEEARQALRMDDELYYADYEDWQPDFRQHYGANYAASGGNYLDYDFAYRYGYDLATDERFEGHNWEEIEPQARLSWEGPDAEATWEEIKGAVQHAWDQVTGAFSGETHRWSGESANGCRERDPEFRRHYRSVYGTSGYPYTRYEYAYHYGCELAKDERYRGRRWDQVERHAQREWQTRGVGLWEEFRDAVRHAWRDATGGGDPSSSRSDLYSS